MLMHPLDPEIKRTVTDGFVMPLGVNPIEPAIRAVGSLIVRQAADPHTAAQPIHKNPT